MEPIVVDSSVIVASLLEADVFHRQGQEYVEMLAQGDFIFHLPMLVAVEVMSAISRRATKNRLALLERWKQIMVDWESSGKIFLYSLDSDRMDKAVNIARSHRLRGADSVIAALAEELGMPLKTYDTEILARFPQASV